MSASRLYHTLRHLKPEQWFYRIWYKLKKRFYSSPSQLNIPMSQAMVFGEKQFYKFNIDSCYRPADNTFTFLNISHTFGNDIDWDIEKYGKLWAYNLNYFAWLNDESLSAESKLRSIHSYLLERQHENGAEPYPTSLRGINWIKFLVQNNVRDEAILSCLYKDYDRLAAFPEYHILANHLLENGFSLFFAGHYFNDKDLYETAHHILEKELREQVLGDGAHYELSPMYHCIVLQRLLECIELYNQSDRFRNKELHMQMEATASKMLGWLQAFCFKDGSYAMLGDAAPGIALPAKELYAYARHLGVNWVKTKLKDCGYRKMASEKYELILDAGNIIPSYQPGHAHADTFTYCLNVEGRPIIVDTGISTYDKNSRRLEERGTAGHNTVSMNGQNSSDVWGGFRVGKRATVSIMSENAQQIKASHNGYRYLGVIHERSFTCTDDSIVIADKITGGNGQQIHSHIHFHPSCKVTELSPHSYLIDNIKINISGGTGATLVNYLYCSSYNNTESAPGLRIHIERNTVVSIEL